MTNDPAIRRSGMTLLELLGVMLVCFILWGFLFPASESMVRNGRRRQAEADIQTLANAVLAYQREYGFFPAQGGDWDADIIYLPEKVTVGAAAGFHEIEAERLLQCLSPTNEVDNPRGVVFMEDTPSRIEDDVFLDPWGDPYVVLADGNADGWIGSQSDTAHTVTSFDVVDSGAAPQRTHRGPSLREQVYVFSWGNSFTNAITTAGERK